MKTSLKKILFIEISMIFFLILNFFISNAFKPIFYVIFLSMMLLLAILFVGFDRSKNVYRKQAFTNVAIVVTAYFLVTYLMGLIVGFIRTHYNGLSVTNIQKNIIPFILIVIISELLRFIFINKSNKNKIIVLLSFMVFSLFTVSYNFKLYDFTVYNDIFQFLGIIVLGNIASNIFFTIQCVNTGYVNNILYRLVMEGYIFIVPFTPKLGPYVTALLAILIPTICSFLVFNKKEKLGKALKSKKKSIVAIILVLIVIIVGMSNSGFFKYQNMTIGSNSMKPYMSKGDIIILEKLKGKELDELKKGDILIFRYETKVIAHRIYEVYDNGIEKKYRTKGDANDNYDNTIINEKDVIGILRYRIRYIGLPSIWVREMFE